MRSHEFQVRVEPHGATHLAIAHIPPFIQRCARAQAVAEMVRPEVHDIHVTLVGARVGAAGGAELVRLAARRHLEGLAGEFGTVKGKLAVYGGQLYAAALRGRRFVGVFGGGGFGGGFDGEPGVGVTEAAAVRLSVSESSLWEDVKRMGMGKGLLVGIGYGVRASNCSAHRCSNDH